MVRIMTPFVTVAAICLLYAYDTLVVILQSHDSVYKAKLSCTWEKLGCPLAITH